MTDLKQLFRENVEQNSGYELVGLSDSQKALLERLETLLTSLSDENGYEFGMDSAGMELGVSIASEDSACILPFTLTDEADGSARLQMDSSTGAPVAFNLDTDTESFVRFLASEQPARILRTAQFAAIADYYSNKPVPAEDFSTPRL